MIVIGLDMSLTGTGFCKIENEDLFIKTISSDPKNFKNRWDRYDYLVNECLKDIPKVVDLICIEEYFSGQNKETVRKLTELGTLIRHKLYHLGYKYMTVEPTQLKKYVLGTGKGEKSLILKEVYKKWNIDAKDDNQADACVLAKIAECIVNKVEGKNKEERDFFKKLKEREVIN